METKNKQIPIGDIHISNGVIGIVVALIVIAILAAMSIVTVPAGNEGVLLQWGGITNTTLGQGIHFIIPIAQSMQLMNVQTQLYQSNESAASKDLQDVYTTIAVNYRLNPAKVNKIYNNYSIYYATTIIAPAISSVTKAVTAEYNASDLIDERPLIQINMQQQLTERLALYDIQVQNVSIVNFAFSPQYAAAIESKVTTQQLLQQQLINLTIAHVKANQTVAKALGNATSQVVIANGTARAIGIINNAIENDPAYLKWLSLQRWNGQLPYAIGGNGAVPFINLGSFNTSLNNT